MLKKTILIFVMLCFLAPMANAVMLSDSCEYAENNPMCDWCWDNCYFSMMAEIWVNDINWDF